MNGEWVAAPFDSVPASSDNANGRWSGLVGQAGPPGAELTVTELARGVVVDQVIAAFATPDA